jgi:hypothetical protein
MRIVRTHDGLPAGSLVGTVGNDSPDVVLETGIQHSIGLIKGEVLNTGGISFDLITQRK